LCTPGWLSVIGFGKTKPIPAIGCAAALRWALDKQGASCADVKFAKRSQFPGGLVLVEPTAREGLVVDGVGFFKWLRLYKKRPKRSQFAAETNVNEYVSGT
jgi:hypothetical protein